ncbi:hypothetical protein [Sulfobacillus harzensis]|uniref:Uncharacterized protein n=1 Tax=Sulfobacillus harzensis TaxID=2729629 RepID=A0A7Y0L3U1_9FIRM|nr:hypothetical protein [Sulfobacillus harzensis]NMP22573.1 hypothetical protein [Sulfobacillus harzensis]
MAVTRTVFLPLKREPEILFGMTLADLIWVMAAAALDLVWWRMLHQHRTAALAIMAATTTLGLAMALVRLEGTSLPEWACRAAGFWLRPRLFLP